MSCSIFSQRFIDIVFTRVNYWCIDVHGKTRLIVIHTFEKAGMHNTKNKELYYWIKQTFMEISGKLLLN